jgi:hypothetical protein
MSETENIGLPNWRHWLHRQRATLMLVAALILIIVSPIEDYWHFADFLLAPAVVLLVLVTVQPGAEGRKTFYAISVLAIGWLAAISAYIVLHAGQALPSLMTLGLSLVVLHTIARQIIRAKLPNWDTLSAALTGYLFIAVAWAQIYYLIFLADPDSFSITRSPAIHPALFIYFSFQSITTLGYGNIVPVNPFVGMLATSEAVVGQFYVATVIARLVSLAYNKPPAGR